MKQGIVTYQTRWPRTVGVAVVLVCALLLVWVLLVGPHAALAADGAGDPSGSAAAEGGPVVTGGYGGEFGLEDGFKPAAFAALVVFLVVFVLLGRVRLRRRRDRGGAPGVDALIS